MRTAGGRVFATVRRYRAIPLSLLGALASHAHDIAGAMRDAPGFVSFELMRTRDGMLAVIVAEDETSALDIDRRGAEWMTAHLEGHFPPTWDVLSGDVLVHAGR